MGMLLHRHREKPKEPKEEKTEEVLIPAKKKRTKKK